MSKLVAKVVSSEKDGGKEEKEEEDFMSDKFIVEAEKNSLNTLGKQDDTYSERRRKKLNETYEKGKTRPREEREKQKRQQGLSKSLFGEMEEEEESALTSTTKGKRKERLDSVEEGNSGSKALRMMLSMGFKPGKGIGKFLVEDDDDDDSQGESESEENPTKVRIDPLDIDERWINPRIRSGIGINPRINTVNKAISKDINSAVKSQENSNPNGKVEEDFRLRSRQVHEQRHLESLLVNARKTCHDLDTLPPFDMAYSPLWINPESLSKQKSELPPHVSELIEYAFAGLNDLISEEGADKELKDEDSVRVSNHTDEKEKPAGPPSQDDEKNAAIQRALDAKRFCFLSSKARLQITLSHLRRTHHYCLFCGHQYTSQEEMESQCPGEEEEDH